MRHAVPARSRGDRAARQVGRRRAAITAGSGAPGHRRPTRPAVSRPRAGKPKPEKGPTPTLSRVERRRQLEVRRTRTFVAGAVVLSVAVVAAWFPASALMSDRKTLATVTTQLDTLRRQDHALAQERARLGQSAEIERLARQQYQMTSPGAQEYQVLPKSSAGATSANDAYSSDPGLQRPVAPSGTAQLPPGTLTDGIGGPGVTSGSSGSGGGNGAGKGQGLLERIVHTLEFWR